MARKLIWMISVAICCMLGGCAQEGVNEAQSSNENPVEPELIMNATYYKLTVETLSVSQDEIIRTYIPNLDDYSKAITHSKLEIWDQYSLDIDEINYKWSLTDYSFWFAINNEDEYKPVDNYEKARRDVDAVISKLGVAVSDIVEEDMIDGACHYVYSQQYEGTDILGNASVNIEKDSQVGSFIAVTVDGDGVRTIKIYNLVDVTNVLETYNSADFISLESAQSRAEDYCRKMASFMGMDSREIDVSIKDVSVIYIPYIEKEQKVLIPAYRLNVTEKIGNTKTDAEYILDVFNGYVYGWRRL